jgi:Na+/H+ antiporter NhaC
MSDKFKANIWIAGPAAIVVALVYVVIGLNLDVQPEIGQISIFKLIPYLSVIIMAIMGVNVLVVLTIGLAMCAGIGFIDGMSWTGFLGSIGEGIAGMGDLIIVTMLAGGMLEIIRHNGGIDFIINGLTKGIKGRIGAEFSIASLVGLSNFCTANNTIAILTTGNIAKDISKRFGVDPRKSASILDTFSCVVQGIIPYGAQLLMASSFAGIPATAIIPNLYYPLSLLVTACLAILLRFPKKYS